MNKTDLVAAVAAQAGLTKAQAQKAVEATVDAIAGALKGGDKVQLVGFGTFSVVEKAAREGVNQDHCYQKDNQIGKEIIVVSNMKIGHNH